MKKTGFSLMEMIVVIVIIGLVAAFAIPNYHKTIVKTTLKSCLDELNLVHGSQKLYRIENGNYFPEWGDGDATWAQMKVALGLELLPQDDVTYSCLDTGNNQTFDCRATGNANLGNFVAQVTHAPLSATNPACISNCP